MLEGPELWHDITSVARHWRFKHRFRFSLPEEHAPNWAKLLAAVGWLLIVLGVAGEYVADSFVSKADGYVQTFDEILLAEAQRKTGVASERAARAFERAAQTEQKASQENERAARAEQQATEENARAAKALEAAEVARKNAEGFSLQIAQANERAAQAEKQAADANGRAAQAELELAKIRQPRSLNPEQQKRVGDSLTKFTGENFAFLVFGDPESLTLLNDINAALKIAKWNRVASPPGLGGDTGFNIEGINVPSVNEVGVKVWAAIDDPVGQSIALAFQRALLKQGIPCEAHISEKQLKGLKLLVITVGQKRL